MSESIRELLEREAAEAEALAGAEDRGEVSAPPGQRGNRKASDPSQVYPVRIPVARINELREVAEKLDIPPTTLIRQWVIRCLDEISHGVVDGGNRPNRPVGEPPVPGEIRLGPRRRIESSRRSHDSVTRERKHA
jgi:hypothetical protein